MQKETYWVIYELDSGTSDSCWCVSPIIAENADEAVKNLDCNQALTKILVFKEHAGWPLRFSAKPTMEVKRRK